MMETSGQTKTFDTLECIGLDHNSACCVFCLSIGSAPSRISGPMTIVCLGHHTNSGFIIGSLKQGVIYVE